MKKSLDKATDEHSLRPIIYRKLKSKNDINMRIQSFGRIATLVSLVQNLIALAPFPTFILVFTTETTWMNLLLFSIRKMNFKRFGPYTLQHWLG